MINVNFCRAPSHLWVGWCVYENGTYYASGNTLDKMLYCIKRKLWTEKRISVRGVVLAGKQSDPSEAPISVFKSMFLTKYWYPKGDNVVKTTPKASAPAETVKEQAYDYYDTEYQDGTLIVYGVMKKKVAEYKLGRPPYLTPVTPKIDPMPFQQPIVRYDTTNKDSYADAQKEAAKWKPRADIPME